MMPPWSGHAIALVLKSGSAGSPEYPKIKGLARREKAEIYSGAAAQMRSDHHSGRTWGRRGETPIVQATGARSCTSRRIRRKSFRSVLLYNIDSIQCHV